MSIFNNDIERIKKENQTKIDDEKMRLQNELRAKETAVLYIIECLEDFPTAAKKVNLPMIQGRTPGIFFNKKIYVWSLGSYASYIDLRGVCYTERIRSFFSSTVSTKKMAEHLYNEKFSYLSHETFNKELIQEAVKKHFLRLLGDR